MMYTTLNKIRAHHPCTDGWRKLMSNLGKTEADDEPLSFLTILESNGLDDAIWCLRSVPEYAPQSRLFAVWCARRVWHLMKDPRSIAVLDVAERHARGEASDEELAAARAAAWDAAWAAVRDAWGAAWDAAWTAARDAAWGAAWAAWDAAWAAGDAAGAAAGDAAWTAARDAERAAQEKEFRRMIEAV